MENEIATTGAKQVSQFLNQKNVLEKFSSLLGDKAQGFIASVISAVNSNALLKNATNESIYASALMAATLDLPVNQNLGFAYFIPFNNKKTGHQECQFQIGYKGFIQLAQRSGQFKSLGACPVYEGQLIKENPLEGFEFDFRIKSNKVIGYAASFKLLLGFEKTLYMSIEDLESHGTKYSQTFKKGFGLWNDNFDAMATKTVLKLLLSKYAPLSIEMQKAQIVDQSVIRNVDRLEIEYVDNEKETASNHDLAAENQRKIDFINNAKSVDELNNVGEFLDNENQIELFEAKKISLQNKK